MDELKSKVSSIQSSLQECRRLLSVYERSASTDIGKDVTGMRDALLNGQQRVQQTITEIQGFMLMIEDRPASEVDLKPQIAWLSGCITNLLADFESAESKAKDAMTQTMNYEAKINDVSQDIQVQQRELGVARQNGEDLASRAAQQLLNSERLIEEKGRSLQQRKNDIDEKTREAANLRERLPGYQRTLREKEQSLVDARRKAEDKKEKAIAGFGIAALGVIAAPFTFGLSLAATGVAAGIGVGMSIDYNELKDQISSTQSGISSLNSQISSAESSVARLTREKDALETSISQLRSTIQSQKWAQSTYRSQITNANGVQADVSLLRGAASSTMTSVQNIAGQLLELKQALNECAAVLDAENTELRVKSSAFDRLMFRGSRQKLELQRERAVILQATEALSNIGTKIPGLLPGSNMKFLELKSSVTVVTTPVVYDIPPLTSRMS